MNQQEKNKQFLEKYQREIRRSLPQGMDAFWKTIHRYVADQKLIDHITFFMKAFPNYNMIVEDVIAEGDRVFVKMTFLGKHEGEMDGIPPGQGIQ